MGTVCSAMPVEEDHTMLTPAKRQNSVSNPGHEVQALPPENLAPSTPGVVDKDNLPEKLADKDKKSERKSPVMSQQNDLKDTARTEEDIEDSDCPTEILFPPAIRGLPQREKNLLVGRFEDEEARCQATMVKFFVHSSGTGEKTDSALRIISTLNSTLTEYCRGVDYDLEIIGPNYFLNVTDLQRQTFEWYLDECRKHGVIVFHVMFVTEDGTCPPRLPQTIESEDYDLLMKSSDSDEKRGVLADWLKPYDDGTTTYYLQLPGNASDVDKDDNALKSMPEQALLYDAFVLNPYLLQKYCKPRFLQVLTRGGADREGMLGNIVLICRSSDTNDQTEMSAVSEENNIVPGSVLAHLQRQLPGENIFYVSEKDWTLEVGVKNMADFVFKRLKDQIMDRDKNTQSHSPTGLVRELANEIEKVFQFCRSKCDPTFCHERPDVMARLNSYMEASSNDVLHLTGETGSGKTTAMCSLAQTMSSQISKWSVITRFVGLTSCKLGDAIYSIILQISMLHDLQLPDLSQDPAQALGGILLQVPPSNPLLVIIDGIDQAIRPGATADWLPSTLPSHVKMIVTCKCMQGKVAKRSWVDLPPIDRDTVLQFLVKWLSIGRFQSVFHRIQHIPSSQAAMTPMQLAFLAETDPICVEEIPNNGPNPAEVLDKYLNQLENEFTFPLVSKMIGFIAASRCGLLDSELCSLLARDPEIQQKPSIFGHEVYLRLRKATRPILYSLSEHGRLIHRLQFGRLEEVLRQKYYTPNKATYHSALMEYYRSLHGVDAFSQKGMSQSQSVTSDERRFIQELPHHAFFTKTLGAFCSEFIYNPEWMTRKLFVLGFSAVLQDVDLCNGKDDSVGLLRECLVLSRYALSIDPFQLVGHLYGRLQHLLLTDASSLAMLKKFVDGSLQLNVPYLLPSRGALRKVTRTGRNNQHGESAGDINVLRRFLCYPDKVVALSTQSGELTLWDVSTLEKATILTNLESPRDIKLLDSKRAAILCNRTIEIYNLETGGLETKLKGVLNATRPYYGIHDDKHVIALSRNRMYVNVMSTESGDMVSTFKVGESRFLDSLLVSGNGEVAVCGDETQKPFPLLVWDLPQRKLIHDMRLSGHEFLTAMSDISHDGRHVACVAKELDVDGPNFITVYDLSTGQLSRTLKPETNTTCVKISSPTGTVVAGLWSGELMEWSLADGTQRNCLKGAGGYPASLCLSENGQRVASVNKMSVHTTVCLFDLYSGALLGTFTPDSDVICCQISASGEKVLLGLAGQPGVMAVWPGNHQSTERAD